MENHRKPSILSVKRRFFEAFRPRSPLRFSFAALDGRTQARLAGPRGHQGYGHVPRAASDGRASFRGHFGSRFVILGPFWWIFAGFSMVFHAVVLVFGSKRPRFGGFRLPNALKPGAVAHLVGSELPHPHRLHGGQGLGPLGGRQGGTEAHHVALEAQARQGPEELERHRSLLSAPRCRALPSTEEAWLSYSATICCSVELGFNIVIDHIFLINKPIATNIDHPSRTI